MIQITAIHIDGTARHEHITALQWRNTQSGVTGQSTRDAIISWLDESKANQAVVADNATWVYVGVYRVQGAEPYLRTHADGKWNDNLLALPPF